ncbi:Protein of unknown function [Paracoccus aminovorans]|uniref:DUF3649 domain-containing protein n=1 Tax=Paracoccus aminovorans TaxID=34004 RepID=A0A1I3AP43_9RHOB|nr:DUF3649 domain-containing protein [Paracoccus aminovorans]CQR84303.1 hypothetical protein JCM7685_pAMV3p0358 [Paracoccus aminovorans]SFH51825.1 Protein of unknown function [Paracoccus aminovorans]
MPALARNPRLATASRSLAAIGGGYLAANLFVLAFARLAPLAPRDALEAGMMLGFVLFALAAIWAFACRSAWQAWAGILGVALLCGLVVLPRGGA